jgi:hypothetical protein
VAIAVLGSASAAALEPEQQRGAKVVVEEAKPNMCASLEVEAGRLYVPQADADAPVLARSTIPCRYSAPAAEEIEVRYSRDGQSFEALQRVAGPKSCGVLPAFYVVEQNHVQLCQRTCDSLQGEPAARVRVASSACR